MGLIAGLQQLHCASSFWADNALCGTVVDGQ